VDTRFLYAALHCAALLRKLDTLDVDAAVDYVMRCQNFDGAFGLEPGCESHTGQVFCCVGALSIAGRLQRLDCDRLGRWCAAPPVATGSQCDDRRDAVTPRRCPHAAAQYAIWHVQALHSALGVGRHSVRAGTDAASCCRLSERQTRSGGLQGRPEKLQDVCYSWWALSALTIMGRAHWIDREALSKFIFYAQDEHGGGISDRPDDMVDVFHTFFGLASLALMGHEGLRAIDPTFALPVAVVERLGLR
jgi:geranylgeranyl transferase type-2 subunit beta